MKNLIMFFVLVMVMVFSNYEVSYSQGIETGNFYFLIGTEGNERAIMYLHVVGDRAYGSYYTESQDIGFNGSFDGKNLKLSYHDYNDRERTITGSLSSDIVFRGKHNSKNINLSLVNAPINTMKIFSYSSYNDDEYHSITTIQSEDYNERKFINDYSETINSFQEEYNYDSSEGESVVYLDDRIAIFCIYYSGMSTATYMGTSYNAFPLNSIKNKSIKNSIKLSDFIANTKDRRLLSLVRDKFNEDFNEGGFAYDFEDIDDALYDGVNLEYSSFSISPKGTITIYQDTIGRISQTLEATFTFEELKPFIKRGSVLDYLFN